jgi:hypothetical protein
MVSPIINAGTSYQAFTMPVFNWYDAQASGSAALHIYPEMAVNLIQAAFQPMDLLFYGICSPVSRAVYEGFNLSIHKGQFASNHPSGPDPDGLAH